MYWLNEHVVRGGVLSLSYLVLTTPWTEQPLPPHQTTGHLLIRYAFYYPLITSTYTFRPSPLPSLHALYQSVHPHHLFGDDVDITGV